jgi:hypothetical protein
LKFRRQLASIAHPLEALGRLALAEWAGAAGEAVGLIWGEASEGFQSRHEVRLDHRLKSSELLEYEERSRRALG